MPSSQPYHLPILSWPVFWFGLLSFSSPAPFRASSSSFRGPLDTIELCHYVRGGRKSQRSFEDTERQRGRGNSSSGFWFPAEKTHPEYRGVLEIYFTLHEIALCHWTGPFVLAWSSHTSLISDT
ncbi:hypothetical protein BDP55DRAFT_266976 [Colletotrichum godetiae]|uniref:Secreted protein n=1 Tax=Colletotrichum godetiae TaxID=1209918 RepID=A0AAJ0EYX6_9PEZI|nr:uncharacterized protein BDP55DRAFT_266976 [Colletotrichum godetiae]KAK1691525.1 hypothetical protein BDP55DRAFT_266976 [Colletotrichum godetiae]